MINSYNTSAVYISGLCFLRALCERCVPQRPTSRSVLFWFMKDIPWWEGKYAATEDGRVWSYPKKWKWGHNGKFVACQKTNCWYLLVRLHKDSICYAKTVHRLIATTYLKNPENKPQVNHKNGIKTDNRVENLEWMTRSENMIHARDYLGWNHQSIKKKIMQMDKQWNCINVFSSLSEASKYTNIHFVAISICAKWITKTSWWFTWKYLTKIK